MKVKGLGALLRWCFCHGMFMLGPLSLAAQDAFLCKGTEALARSEARAAEQKLPSRFYRETASELIDVVYHRCAWSVNPAIQSISGTVTTTYLPKTFLSEVVFDLKDNMVVDKVTRKGIPLTFSRKDHTVTISLGTIIIPGRLDSLSIEYHGMPVATGFGSFTTAFHGTTPVLWTLSEPYGARDWWPCKNTLDDKIDSIDIFITCPKAYKGVSNGIRQSVIPSADGLSQTTHWKHRYPMVSYLVCMAVTDYEEFNHYVQLGSTNLLMQTFCYPESAEDFRNNTQSTLDALQFFHRHFGAYPFLKEKYGHTQFSWGGGEEHQTNSFVINPGEELCAHELAHQWFGDKITCGSWEDIWLNEGFATYLANIFLEDRHPESIITRRRNDINNITSDSAGSVRVNDTLDFRRIFSSRLTYLKGAHLLYMLRLKLGTDVFYRAIRAYQQDPVLAYRFARTNDLQRHLEQESGQHLDSFFRQWFSGQGYPSYKVLWTQVGTDAVKLKISQSTSHSSVAFFQLPVPVRFKNSQRDTTLVLDNISNGQTFVRSIGFIADSAFVDPEYWLISKNNVISRVTEIEPDARDLFVYPNPFTDQFQVMLRDFPGSTISVTLFSMLGQTVWSGSYPLYQGKGFLTINPPALASGRYILQVQDESGARRNISLLRR